MRKTLIFVTCSLLLIFFFSCDKMFVHISGKEADLQGKWKMDDDVVYYNFQNSLFQYQMYQNENQMISGIGYYILNGETHIELRLLQEHTPDLLVKHLKDDLKWDVLPSSTGKQKQDTIFRIYKIDKFTKKELILSSDNERLSFYKF